MQRLWLQKQGKGCDAAMGWPPQGCFPPAAWQTAVPVPFWTRVEAQVWLAAALELMPAVRTATVLELGICCQLLTPGNWPGPTVGVNA